MNTPVWLAELHRQWLAARGLSLQAPARPFSRAWPDLLDAAGLQSAAERSHAETEAKRLEQEGRLTLRSHKYRHYLIEKVAVPIAQERWLVELFGGTPACDLRQKAMETAAAARSCAHARWPESWDKLCERLATTFAEGRNQAPFLWKDPDAVRQLLEILRALTEKEWPPGTLLGVASTALTGDSKLLERRQQTFESALCLLFEEEFTLEALGILGPQSRALLHGNLCLDFADGSRQAFEQLVGEYTVSIEDLLRAERASTTATRILSIENARTTFRQVTSLEKSGETLILATSYPNAATKHLLEILPADLPHFHFGDTDASGYAILRSLREATPRPVAPFLMAWNDKEHSLPLSEHDRRILPALLTSPLMEDCRESLQAMASSGHKGQFEQEAHGAPTLNHWPFWPTFA